MITSTIKATNLQVYVCDRKDLQVGYVTDTIYNEVTEEQATKAMFKKWNTKNNAFVRCDIIGSYESKFELDEQTFIENARILKEDDSKIGLITRTLKSYYVTYTAITKDKQFVTESCSVSKLVEKQLMKELEQDAKDKGYAMVFDHEKPSVFESLYGMERTAFLTLAKESEER